jgi:predicted RNase H-like HicB family nuclease
MKKFTITLKYSKEDKAWIARCKELDGCVTHGKTIKKAMKYIGEAMRLHLDCIEESNEKQIK